MTTQSLSDELNVLKSIYAGDFTTIPLEIGYCKSIKMHLYPEEESSPENFYLELILHIPKQYPEQIPKLEAGEYKGITREQVKELLDQIFDLSLKLSGHNMLLDLIASCKEILNKCYAKYIHSLNTQEDLYEKFQMNQKLREEEEKRLKAAKLKEEKIGGESVQEKELGRIMFMNEVEESKLREKWFSAREEDRKNIANESDNDSDRVDEYSAGCELIPLKDLFIIQLLKVISALSSKVLGSDENSLRNMLYNEVKSMDIMNEDALELLKKRANTIFNKLYREKIRLQTRKQKKKQHNNIAIEDLLFKPVLSATDNQFFKLIENVKKSNGAETQQQHQRNDSIEIIYDKEGDLPDSMADTEEKEEDRKEDQTINLPLIERTSSIDTSNLTKGAVKSPLPTLGHSTSKNFTSRYQEDFEEIEFLGRGASSEVVKVRNKLDGRFYAIKKIMIKQGQRLTRIMREVQTLSRLHHQNIIRYYQAWLEEVPDSEKLALEDLDEEEENDDPDTDSKSFDLSGGFSSTYTESFNDNPDRLMLQFSEKKILCLCIQTEYCQQALRATLNDPQLDANTIWRLFRQILEALAYIHTQKVIHRDLKPENIFMGIGGDIKIGDFGLATKHQTQLHSSEKNKINNLLNLKKSQMTEKEFSELDKTMNVGTYFYRAYEVDRKETTTYDEKVDVYSLGIILFEMWHPFTSRYERYKILFDLKNKRKLPPKFEEAHPRQSRLIKWMLERDPTQRPTVVEILNNDLLPPKMEDDYMNDVIKSVSNPNTIFYKKLIEALFQNKGPGSSYNSVLCAQSLWEATYNHSQEIFVNLVSQRMSNHLRYMGALPITTPILNPLESGSSGTRSGMEGYGLFENDPRVTFVNKLGYLEYLRINPRKEFEQYLQNLNPKFLATNFFKSFDITDVYSSRVNEGIIKQTVLDYNSLIMLPDYYNTNAAETILLNLISLDRQFAALSSANPQSANNLLKIKFTHMALVKMLFQTMKISNKGKIIQILRIMYGVIQSDLSLAQAKVKIQQIITISDKEFDRLITFFTLNGTLEQCKRTFESLLPNHEKLTEILKKLENVFNEIKDLFNTYKDLMKEKQKNLSSLPDFELDMSILDPELLFKKDIYYEIRYRDLKLNRYELLSFGGVYRVKLDKIDGLHKQEIGHEAGKSRNLAENSHSIYVGAKNKKKKEVCGFTIYLEKLSRIIYGNLMRTFQTEKSNKIAANVFFKYEVMICSLGADPAATKVKLSMICWQLKIPNLLYITGDPNTSLEEQLECAEKNDINLVIIIKEKIYQSKQKITLRWKKEKNKVEKECTMEELIAFLSKSFKGGSSAPSLS